MPSLREIKDSFEAIIGDQKTFEAKAKDVQSAAANEAQELRAKGWGRVTQSLIDHLKSSELDIALIRQIDQILDLDLEGKIIQRDRRIAGCQETLRQNIPNETSRVQLGMLEQKAAQEESVLNEQIHKAEARLAPVREFGETLKISGLPELNTRAGEAFWQPLKREFFFFWTKKRAAVKSLLKFEAENSISPFEEEGFLKDKRDMLSAVKARYGDLLSQRMYLQAKEKLEDLQKEDPFAMLSKEIAATRINREVITKIEVLTGDDFSDARQHIALGDAVLRLKEEIGKVVSVSTKTTNLLEKQLSKVKKGIRHRSRKKPRVDLKDIQSKVTAQRDALSEPLGRLERSLVRGRSMSHAGRLPAWDAARYDDLDAFETVMWALIFSHALSDNENLDIGDLDVKAFSDKEAFGPIDVGGIDVGSIDIPSVDLSVIDTATSGLSASDFSAGSSSFGGSSFSGGFGD